MQLTRYNQTDKQLHALCQIIAKANRTFVPKKEDDSHTNLYYDSLAHRILGRWFELNNLRILMTLNLESQCFEIVDDRQQVHTSVSFASKSSASIESELEQALKGLGIDTKSFQDAMHYHIPDYDFATNHGNSISQEALAEWGMIRSMANDAAHRFIGHVQTKAEVRIWPHHFDTGIYTEVNNKLGIGFGLAMKDNMVGAPYFYVTGYPSDGKIDYEDLHTIGQGEWIVNDDWKGAVLSLNHLNDRSDYETRNIINEYINEAVRYFLSVSE
ncbi:MAG: hypothetical protein Salg2KO_21900 [Salibacteraceae bacterium]